MTTENLNPHYHSECTYAMLVERYEDAAVTNIPYQTPELMPDKTTHVAYLQTVPYGLLAYDDTEGQYAGFAYVNPKSEVGVFVRKGYRRQGVATHLLKQLFEDYKPRPVFATINSANTSSMELIKTFDAVPISHRFVVK